MDLGLGFHWLQIDSHSFDCYFFFNFRKFLKFFFSISSFNIKLIDSRTF